MVVTRAPEVRFLGVIIDEGLTWKSHVNYISLKISHTVGILNHLRFVLTKNCMKTLYNALMYPMLNYCIIVWGPASKTALDRLNKLQKRAIRLISFAAYYAHTNTLFMNNNLLKLDGIYNRELAIFLYKSLHGLLPVCCNHYIIRSQASIYSLRVVDDFMVAKVRTVLRQKFVSCAGPKLWRTIPSSITASATLTSD